MALSKQYLSLGLLFLLMVGLVATEEPAEPTTIVITSTAEPTTTVITSTTAEPTTTVITSITAEPTTTVITSTTVKTTTATTKAPATGETTAVTSTTEEGGTTKTTNTATTSEPGPCTSSPCPSYTICQELLNKYTCLCDPGLFYDKERESCILAKMFSSDLILNKTFEAEMANNKSQIFQETAYNILKELKVALEPNPAYLGSTVLQFKQVVAVAADVENFYTALSDVAVDTVETALEKAFSGPTGILSGAEVTFRDICTRGFCDESSTDCISNNGLATCTCKEGYVKITTTRQACTPCPSGKKAVNSEQCDKCPFGYSGFDCKELYLLILVVVACVLGTLLLSSLIGVILMYSRAKKTPQSSEKTNSSEFTKPVSMPKIPRANANSDWQPSNLEMTDSGSRHALVTRGRPENSDMWDYDYSVDPRNYRMPSKTGNGAIEATNGPRATRNPYYDDYGSKMARY